MDNAEPTGCLLASVSFAIVGGLILAMGLSALKVSIAKAAWWEEAVKHGYAEKVTHSGGEGYRWKNDKSVEDK